MSPAWTRPKVYRFSELDREHQLEIVGNLGRPEAEKTVWEFVPDYPVDLAAAIAWDTSITIFDNDVAAVASRIKRAGKVLRPVLIDDLHEGQVWMEGKHRSIASEELGLKTIPAFVRVE